MRLQAAEWFAEGVTPPEVARRLRVSVELGVRVATALAGRLSRAVEDGPVGLG